MWSLSKATPAPESSRKLSDGKATHAAGRHIWGHSVFLPTWPLGGHRGNTRPVTRVRVVPLHWIQDIQPIISTCEETQEHEDIYWQIDFLSENATIC